MDPLKDVEALGKKLGFTFDAKNFHNISLGQGQEVVAERAMDLAAKEGHWVVLQVGTCRVTLKIFLQFLSSLCILVSYWLIIVNKIKYNVLECTSGSQMVGYIGEEVRRAHYYCS